MTTEEWRNVKSITAEALARPAGERASYLADACRGNEGLYGEVVSWLEATLASADMLEAPAPTTPRVLAALTSAVPSRAGGRIGPYRLLRELGRGGMGMAYLAERDDGEYRRLVAIKFIKRGMDTDAIVGRFLKERQILAGLNHPNIAMLLDGGSTPDGLPYFVMEYVSGQPIDVYCDAHRLSIPSRLDLLRAVCSAVEHAHASRVVHRDLKPGNILVTAESVPKLLDFGIAKLLDPEPGQHAEATLATHAMTPQYASPEQLRGLPITPASDIYALGLLMYELLAGCPPYRVGGLAPMEAGRLVCAGVPSPPSAAVQEDAAAVRGLSLSALRRHLAGPLDAVVMTALQKAPDRRYTSARALADDITRYLEGRPVSVRSAGPASRLAAAWHTHRRWLGASALVAGAAAVAFSIPRSLPPEPKTRVPAVAVLPSPRDPAMADTEYLVDGILEGVIRELSGNPAMKVIPRDSAYNQQGKADDASAVARALGVDAVVTGHARLSDAGLLLTVEFVSAKDGRRVWQQHYRAMLVSAQAIEHDLAQRIADSLGQGVGRSVRAMPPADRQHVPEAYAHYLRGRYFWNRRTVDSLRRSIEQFRNAVEADTTFALAYTGLADSYSLLTEFHGAPATETYEPARRAALRALEIDPGLAEAHTSLAYIRQFYEWDRIGAEAEFRHALELNPRYATAHQWYSELLSATGRHEQALHEIRLALAQDPVSLIANAVEANVLYMARRYDEAITQARQAIELEPNFPETYEFLKRALDQKGLYGEAVAARQKRRALIGFDVRETDALRLARSATDGRTYWRHRLAQEMAEGRTEGLQPFEMAEIEGQAGNVRGALEWLARACDEHDFMTMYAEVIPTVDALRGDPRYRALIDRGCRVSAVGR